MTHSNQQSNTPTALGIRVPNPQSMPVKNPKLKIIATKIVNGKEVVVDE